MFNVPDVVSGISLLFTGSSHLGASLATALSCLDLFPGAGKGEWAWSTGIVKAPVSVKQ